MNITANYNTDQLLWDNQHKVDSEKPNGGAVLQVFDGMVGNGHNVLARFTTNADAEKVLRQAGYHEIKRHHWKADFKGFYSRRKSNHEAFEADQAACRHNEQRQDAVNGKEVA